MGLFKLIFTIAIFMALSITLTMKIVEVEEKPPFKPFNDMPKPVWQEGKQNLAMRPSKRVTRFLAQNTKNPRTTADHCKKDNDICYYLQDQDQGQNATTCCNNKCVNLQRDKNNCGECKKKCKYTEDCCRGECVILDFDKRHCGKCNNRCLNGKFCVYSMCEYA